MCHTPVSVLAFLDFKTHFIAKIDADIVALGAVLAHKRRDAKANSIR